MPSDEEREAALDLLNDQLERRIQTQFTVADRIDTKAAIVLGFTATAAQFVVTHPHRTGWTTKAAVVGYGVAFIAGLVALGLRKYATVPKPDWLVGQYESLLQSGGDSIRRPILGKLVALRRQAAEHNSRVDSKKTKAWWISLIGLTAGLGFSLISLTR